MDRLNYIERLKDRLHNTDYVSLKFVEGADCSKYGDWKEIRQSLRDEIDKLESMSDDEFYKAYPEQNEIESKDGEENGDL